MRDAPPVHAKLGRLMNSLIRFANNSKLPRLDVCKAMVAAAYIVARFMPHEDRIAAAKVFYASADELVAPDGEAQAEYRCDE